jgi:tetratricopeptide (TPR) repeat protein
MRLRLALKLIVTLLAATAVIYGLVLALGKGVRAVDGGGVTSAATAPGSGIVVIAPGADAAAPGAAMTASARAPAAGDDAGAAIRAGSTYQDIVKNAVRRLEAGDAAQSLAEIRAAIDAAQRQGAVPTEIDALRNMQMRIVDCLAGPESMLQWMQEPDAALAVPDPRTPAAIDRSRMEIEALLSLGRLQEAWDKSKVLLTRFDAPGPGQSKEPLALEQAIRIAEAASLEELVPALEKRLRVAVDAGISLRTLTDPQLPLATLGTLAKMRGDCRTAIKLYDQALEGFDTNQWLRERRIAPWRLQILVLVAMDRVDCMRQTGEVERAKGRATTLAADLATALGEGDPLVVQASDLRDQVLAAPTSP